MTPMHQRCVGVGLEGGGRSSGGCIGASSRAFVLQPRKLSSATKEDETSKDPLALKLWVQGLPPVCSVAQFKQHFEAFGPVVDCSIIRNQKEVCTGVGYVMFANEVLCLFHGALLFTRSIAQGIWHMLRMT